MKSTHFHFAVIALVTALSLSCAKVQDMDGNNGEFSQKLSAQPFIAPLYGKATKTLVVDLNGSKKIDFVTLDHSADYKFFSIDQISVNNQSLTNPQSDADINFDSINLLPQGTSTSPQANKAYLTVSYHASEAPKTENKSYNATALISLDQKGVVSLDLQGMVQGICEDCKAKLGKTLTYTVVDGAFDLYLCDAQAITPDVQTKDPLPDGSVSATPYNKASVKESEITLYTSSDEKGVVLDVGDSAKKIAASIPPFDIAVPGAGPNDVQSVSVAMKPGSPQIQCDLDAKQDFNCSDDTKTGIPLSIVEGLLHTSTLQLTTGSVEPKSHDCPAFGKWTGKGPVNIGTPGEITLIGTATIDLKQDTVVLAKSHGVEGALVVAVIRLKPKVE